MLGRASLAGLGGWSRSGVDERAQGEEEAKARTVSQKVRERDLGRCKTPGRSRRAVHSHHIILVSHGGTDDDWNLVALCSCHHLRGIHGGYMAVSGRAPDQLTWLVGGRVWRGGAGLGSGARSLDA